MFIIQATALVGVIMSVVILPSCQTVIVASVTAPKLTYFNSDFLKEKSSERLILISFNGETFFCQNKTPKIKFQKHKVIDENSALVRCNGSISHLLR
jgi:hypothetical protein